MPLLLLVLLLAGVPAAAGAQAADPRPVPGDGDAARDAARTPRSSAWTDIGYLAIEGGYQFANSGFVHTLSFPLYAEQATLDTEYPKKDGATFNVAWVFRVWRNFAAGIAVGAVTTSTLAPVSGQIPHPLQLKTPRALNATAATERSETGVHIQLGYVVPIGRLLLSVTGGPSYFKVKQSIVNSVEVADAYPYTAPTLQPIQPATVKETTIGYNVAGDAGYYFTSMLGVGATVRYSKGIVALPVQGSTASAATGGFQAAVGLRLRLPKSNKTKTPGKPPTKPVTPGPVKKPGK